MTQQYCSRLPKIITGLGISKQLRYCSNVHSGVMSIKGTIAAQLTTVDNSTSPDRDVRSGIMPQEAAPLAWKEVSKSGVDTASAHTIGAGKALSNELVDRFEAALRRSCKKPYQDVDKLSSAKPSVPHRFGKHEHKRQSVSRVSNQ